MALGKIGRTFERGTSNGAAMRIGSAGVVYPGDLDKTLEIALTMTKPSHGTHSAFSAAGAIACTISNALTEDATLDSILEAALYGAQKGEEIGRKEARVAYGFATYEKIELAAKIAKEA